MSSKKEDSAAGRRYHRLELEPLKLNVTIVTDHDGASAAQVAQLKDFSKSGAGIFTKEKLVMGSTLRLSINSDDAAFAPIEAKVVWTAGLEAGTTNAQGLNFRAGIDFSPKDDDTRENQLQVFRYISERAKRG